MTETIVLAPGNYNVDPDVGSEPERPWRLIKSLADRGIRTVVVSRMASRVGELGPNVELRLLPGKTPMSPLGRLLDRVWLYVYSRVVAVREIERGGVLAVHHFGPCSRESPSLIPRLPVPFVYGPLPIHGQVGYQPGEWALWLGLPNVDARQTQAASAFERMVRPVAQGLWRRTVRRADAVTVEARANIPPERPDSVVIPSCVDANTFCPGPEPPVSGRIVAAGLLVERKGFDVLIQAVALARRSMPEIHLVIAGDGPERKALSELSIRLSVASNVFFVGRLGRDELIKLYRSGVAFCHPARFDSFPVAPLEAMACGLPALVSDFGALPEMIGSGGVVHPVGDATFLAEQIIEFVADRKHQRSIASEARRWAVSHYSPEAMADRYLSLYRSLQTGSKQLAMVPERIAP